MPCHRICDSSDRTILVHGPSYRTTLSRRENAYTILHATGTGVAYVYYCTCDSSDRTILHGPSYRTTLVIDDLYCEFTIGPVHDYRAQLGSDTILHATGTGVAYVYYCTVWSTVLVQYTLPVVKFSRSQNPGTRTDHPRNVRSTVLVQYRIVSTE